MNDAQLALRRTAQATTIHTREGVPEETDAVFDVAVPAARWWDDIAHT